MVTQAEIEATAQAAHETTVVEGGYLCGKPWASADSYVKKLRYRQARAALEAAERVRKTPPAPVSHRGREST